LDKTDDSIPLSVHLTNWQSAESDLPTARDLVAQDWRKAESTNIQAHLKKPKLNLGTNWRLDAWDWLLATTGLLDWL